jgi:hypothetical protein
MKQVLPLLSVLDIFVLIRKILDQKSFDNKIIVRDEMKLVKEIIKGNRSVSKKIYSSLFFLPYNFFFLLKN